jgi:HD-GYP domain-containing protein (c-di-GMP phosphodiesterase class II)
MNPSPEGLQASLVGMLEVATALSSAADLPTLLHRILRTSRQLTASDAGSIYLLERPGSATQESRLWFAASQNGSLERCRRRCGADGGSLAGSWDAEALEQELLEVRMPLTPQSLVGWTALSGEALTIPDVYGLDPQAPYHFDASVDRQLAYRAVSMLTVPMRCPSGEIVGVLQLINRRRPGDGRPLTPADARERTLPYRPADRQLIEALASQAAVCVERKHLIDSQIRLFEAVLTLLARAIDAKSPHTGGHCTRVAELAQMLAREAEGQSTGPLADFRFHTEEEWREFRIGTWLHDCGKITTPDYVVEKSTKLQTLYNRIHEIRTRFDVLLRDARIQQLQAQLAGGDPQGLERAYQQRQRELEEQFAFVAACNIGDESMALEKVERLRRIGGQRWLRHFDGGLGLSWQELERRRACGQGEGPEALPVEEELLADQAWQVIPRSSADFPDPAFGFTMAVPQALYNQGELHNLSIRHGTLSEEERYKIKEHSVHTISMLESLPFPRQLARVPEYAGTHHEALNGSGYPRSLRAEQLSLPARIMAIADVFEALTAVDRPYKKANRLSEAIAILAAFRDRGQIDADLFELFLRSGLYRRYAERFLPPEQIDAVEIGRYLPGGRPGAGLPADAGGPAVAAGLGQSPA